MNTKQNKTLCQSDTECYLSADVLLGVHVAGGSEGVIEQNKNICLHVEGQVRARSDGKAAVRHTRLICTWLCP